MKNSKFIKFLVAFVILAVVGVGVYIGVFRQDLFNMVFTVSFDAQGAELEQTSIVVKKNDTINLPNVEKEGYIFEGWFDNETKWTNETKVTKNVTLKANWKPIEYKITFMIDGVAHVQDVAYGTIPVCDIPVTKEPTTVIEYAFKEWTPTIEKVTGDATYTAVFEEQTRKYHIVLSSNVDGGELSGGGDDFVYESSTTITATEKEGFEFIGWFEKGSETPVTTSKTFDISSITEDKEYEARYNVLYINVSLNIDGNVIDTIKIDYNTAIGKINSNKYGMSAYKIEKLYLENTFETEVDLENDKLTTPTITLYGTWTYIIDNGFYPYLTKFNSASTSTKMEINSYEELVAWIDYVVFNDITNQNYKFILKYKTFSTQKEFTDEINSAINDSSYSVKMNVAFSYLSDNKTASVYISESIRTVEGTLVADEEKTEVFAQLDYALLSTSTGRDSEYKFNIENVTTTIEVETSTQLIYALEKGLKPICKVGSKAESVYNKAKEILKTICDDTMSDITKLRAIYEWLIMNVQYDNKAASTPEIYNNWTNYDSWYAEGVFNNKKAVCDGICKAFLIMARIENIGCVRVVGNQHAWNKVYVDGNWFGVDATHGNLEVSSNEVLTYSNFMFTDAYKESKGYTATNYTELVANKNFSIYDYISFISGKNEYDLLIDNETEFIYIVSLVKAYTSSTTKYTFEVAINYETTITNLLNVAHLNGLNITYGYISNTDTNNIDTYIIYVEK